MRPSSGCGLLGDGGDGVLFGVVSGGCGDRLAGVVADDRRPSEPGCFGNGRGSLERLDGHGVLLLVGGSVVFDGGDPGLGVLGLGAEYVGDEAVDAVRRVEAEERAGAAVVQPVVDVGEGAAPVGQGLAVPDVGHSGEPRFG